MLSSRRRPTLLAALLLPLLTSACASLPGWFGSTEADEVALTNAPLAENPPEPPLIARLPDSLESFDYEGYRFFADADTGYTFRYVNPRKQRMADVYVYPVAEANRTLDHDQLVLGSTRATLQAIAAAASQGLYDNFQVIGAATRARGLRTVARVETTYLRENLASYSLVYQTEYQGTLLKVRVSMPDNDSNRDSDEWDRFALHMFDMIVDELDRGVPLNG